MSRSPLVEYVALSPNYYRGPFKKKKITIHHVAGVVSIETLGSIFDSPYRQAASNYGLDKDARTGLFVEEEHGAWTSSSYANDTQAITIEVSNSSTGGDWPVSDAVYEQLIRLCVDICKRNDMKELVWTGDSSGSLTCHYMFAPTGCPGPFLKERMALIAKEVTRRLQGATIAAPNPPASNMKKIDIDEGGSDIYRLYQTTTGFHLFTTKGERDALLSNPNNGWTDEGIAWKSADTGKVVYRLLNPNTGDHMWTESFNEAATLSGLGWEYEGSNFASAREGKPVYRVANPNYGFHHWTTSANERNYLVERGWNDEGIGFYAV